MTKVSQTDTTKTGEKPEKDINKISEVVSQPNKNLSLEALKLRQEKPIIGGGSYMAPSSGAIKKAKLLLKGDKKKDNKITKTLEKSQKLNICSKSNQTTNMVETYDSMYTVMGQEENVEKINENNSKNSPRLLNRRESISPDDPMEDGDFQIPKKYTAWSELIKAKARETFELETSNKYDSLSSSEEAERVTGKIDNQNENPQKRKKMTKKKSSQNHSQVQKSPNTQKLNVEQAREPTGGRKAIPPPVVLKGQLTDLAEVKKRLSEECGIRKVNFKYTRYNTLITVENEQDHNKLVIYFKEQQVDIANKMKIEFHTYTPAPQKTHAFVVRGLDFEPTPDEVKQAFLDEYEVEVSSVYQMHTKFRPLYMIVTSSAITQKYLQNVVKFLMSVRVFIEERQNVRRIIQCHRCQEWGHATSNCYRAPRCLKCAEGHATKECSKPKETEPKCCNCGGKHPANATSCKVYQRKLLGLESKGNQNKKYISAPQPKENAWQKRALTKDENVQRHTLEDKSGDRGSPPLTSGRQTEDRRLSVNENDRVVVVDEVANSLKIVEELNRKVNFKELNRALKDLNDNISQVKTGVEVFQIYYRFIESLENNYNILN